MNLQQVIKKSTYSQSTGGVLLPATASLSEFQYNVSKVQAEGGRLILGPGTFNLAGNITFASTKTKPFYLEGQGRYRTIVKFLGDYGFRGSGVQHLFMSEMAISGDQSKFAGTAAIKLDTGSNQVGFSNLFIEESFDTGLLLNDTYQVTIEHNWFESGRGVVAQIVDSDQAAQYYISNNQFNASNGIVGLDISVGGEILVVRNYFGNYLSDDSVTPISIAAMRLRGVDSATILANTFESNADVNAVPPADIILTRVIVDGSTYNIGTIYILGNKMVRDAGKAHTFIDAEYVSSLHVNATSINGDGSMKFVNISAGGVTELHLGSVLVTAGVSPVILTGTPTRLFDLARQQLKASHNNWAALSDVVSALVSLGLFDQA